MIAAEIFSGKGRIRVGLCRQADGAVENLYQDVESIAPRHFLGVVGEQGSKGFVPPADS